MDSCDHRFAPDRRALEVLRRLRAAGHEAYFVGGCVRDTLLGLLPKDWDIATNARPEQIEALFARTLEVGRAFGVMRVLFDGGDFEVATFRGEDGYSDGRRPDGVHFTSAEADVTRRDFTINAMLYDPETGRVIDWVGGRRDLDSRLLRTVGDPRKRFFEDHLRLLRAVRFAARTGFEIEAATWAAMVEMATLVTTVSAERIGQELASMLGNGHAGPAVERLDAAGLLRHVLPEVAGLHGVPQPPEFHPEGDVFEHTRLMLHLLDADIRRWSAAAAAESPDTVAAGGGARLRRIDGELQPCITADEDREVLAWAVLLHDVGKPASITFEDRVRFNGHDKAGAALAAGILARLRRPRRVADTVAELVAGHMTFSHIEKMRVAKRRRLLQEPLFALHLALHRLDCDGSHRKRDIYELALRAWAEELARPPRVEPLLSGRDLIALGYAPGPAMGRMLEAVEDARLEGTLDTREDAMRWVAREFPRE